MEGWFCRENDQSLHSQNGNNVEINSEEEITETPQEIAQVIFGFLILFL